VGGTGIQPKELGGIRVHGQDGSGDGVLANKGSKRYGRDVLAGIPDAQLHKAIFWLNSLGDDWRGEVPYRLHEKGHFGLGSAPPFSSEFINYVGFIECKRPNCGDCAKERAAGKHKWRNPEGRLRATRAFRKLRKVAPREFDALYLYCVQQYPVPAISAALNERAARLEKDDRYEQVAVVLLLLSGIDKVQHYW
jgi:hypothetical protein